MRNATRPIWAVKSHSRALATFQNIVKTSKEREPI